MKRFILPLVLVTAAVACGTLMVAGAARWDAHRVLQREQPLFSKPMAAGLRGGARGDDWYRGFGYMVIGYDRRRVRDYRSVSVGFMLPGTDHVFFSYFILPPKRPEQSLR